MAVAISFPLVMTFFYVERLSVQPLLNEYCDECDSRSLIRITDIPAFLLWLIRYGTSVILRNLQLGRSWQYSQRMIFDTHRGRRDGLV